MASKKRDSYTLPEVLRDHTRDIERALRMPADPKTWPEGLAFAEAPMPRVLGQIMVDAIHPELADAMIDCLFRRKMQTAGGILLGKAQKVGGVLQHYTHLDFLIYINYERWRLLTDHQRLALIDHELQHCTVAHDERGNPRNELVPHDLEEFGVITKRWGLWTMAHRGFAKDLKYGEQIDAFEVLL